MRAQSETTASLTLNARLFSDVDRKVTETNGRPPAIVPAKGIQSALTRQTQNFSTRAQKMATTSTSRGRLSATIATALLMVAPAAGLAAPLDLSNTPLFLSGTVQPNIFFLADDSGSMDWNMVTSEDDGVMYLTARGTTTKYTYVFPQACNRYPWDGTNGRILPSEAAVAATAGMPANRHGVWRARYSGYNTLYYNPDVTYTPWEGVDDAGVAFANASPTAARLNPYVSGATINCGGSTYSNTVDLTAVMSWTADNVPRTSGVATADITVTNYYPAQYYTWTDSNGNGVVDADDAHTLYEIRSESSTTCSTGATCSTTFNRPASRTDCTTINTDGTRTCSRSQELQNFANWFQYYRRRILTSKNAIGKVIARSTARVGLGTLHNNGAVDTQISLLNDSVASGNKKALLDAVYKNYASGDTPLRTKLDEVGKYYECATGNIFGLAAGTSCPILPESNGGSCQKNFTVMMTDGYYNDTFTFSATPNNRDGDGNTAFDGGAYADSWSNTLADIAMNYYERDLSALPDNVVGVGRDTAKHQHMVTYTVAFGVNGTLTADPPNTTSPFAWPNPSLSDSNKIDDLRHAAYNGRGLFLSAKSPTELSTALSNALSAIDEQTSSAAAVAVNSRTLMTGSTIYQTRFTSGTWSGDLRALPISTSGVIGTTPLWKAGDQLKSQNWDTDRKIITHNGTSGVPFRWSSLSASQQNALNDNPTTVAVDSDGHGENRLKWLRGDTANEGTGDNFRKRQDAGGNRFVLGDLVNSTPVYVGTPTVLPDSLESVTHTSFRTAVATRAHVIYVGGNDGMLHGFDVATGKELLAYVPSTIYPDLSKLTDPAYTHRYYVDGSPASGDVFGTYSGCTLSPCWRTVLVSGLGGGGKGVFALDITDPATFDETAGNASKIVLWERSAASDNDLGYTFGQPSITKVKTGATTYKWVAIFGNGYNSVNESAALYVVDMENGNLLAKIVADAGNGTSGNGLSTPFVWDENGDYIADYVYAGDLKGNLWKFDLTGNLSAWKVAYGTSTTPRPLFQAVDGTGASQPITERPVVGKHPVTGITGTMVYFGTGRYITNGDRTPPANPTHTFYGIWDKGVSSTTVPVARADLLPQTITTNTGTRTISSTPIAWRLTGSTACQADGTGECLGWRVDLPGTREMSVTDPVLLTAEQVNLPRVIFTTLIPGTSLCSGGGEGWLMELNPINGGLLSEPFIDTNGDGIINSSDTIVAGIDLGIGAPSAPVVINDPARGRIHKPISGSSGEIKNVEQAGLTSPPPPAGGRKSWRQLK